MKKKYLLISGLILGMSGAFAQNRVSEEVKTKILNQEATPALTPTHLAPYLESNAKSNSFNQKAFGDTLYYQDFANGLPAGYRITNANALVNNAAWRWDSIYRQGQFSGPTLGNPNGTPAIGSTTAANGFMSLTADFFNTPLPPQVIAMDTWFTSPKITIPSSPSVFIQFQQFVRYCCSTANDLVLEVSADSLVWDTINVVDDIVVNQTNAAFANPVANKIVDVSRLLANQTQMWYRFRSTGNSHYFWMIDDVAFVEGPAHDFTLSVPTMEFNWDNYAFAPFYNQIPYEVFPPLPFTATISSRGWQPNTNIRLNVDVSQVGGGLLYSTSNNIGSLAQGEDTTFVLTPNPRFVPMTGGDFQVDFEVVSDSTDQFPANNTSRQFFTATDTIMARDDNAFGGATGPGNWVTGTPATPGGTASGDEFLTMYIIEPRTPDSTRFHIPTGVSYFVANDSANIGVSIVPVIWEFDESLLNTSVADGLVSVVATNFFPYTVQASDLNSFITLDFNLGSALTNGLDSSQYMVGWRVTSQAPASMEFSVANDASTAPRQSNVSTFFFHAHSSIWGWVIAQPVIRLNLGNAPAAPLITGIEDEELFQNVIFEVAPNPNNGQFKLTVAAKQAGSFNLNVRNMLGQTVHSELISVNDVLRKDMDFSSFEKGIYFVSIENGSERFVKKVILK